MKKIVLLVAFAGILGVADIGAKTYAEGRMEAKIVASVQGAVGVDVDIDSFPFAGRLLASGRVPKIDLRVERISGRSLEVTNTLVRLEGVELDKARLAQGKAEVTNIDRGTVELTIKSIALSAVAPAEVELRLAGGRLQASFRGRPVAEATLVLSERGALEVRIPPLPVVTISIPGTDLFPCRPDLEMADDEVRLRCSFEAVPPALLRVAITSR
ncbi:MAG TPA: LmeA family phospholipid-binding protein [Acidimicrobiales bacterium]|nr:LmeA family phospholipid-binding protein [Acidimicrobiales bacterium]